MTALSVPPLPKFFEAWVRRWRKPRAAFVFSLTKGQDEGATGRCSRTLAATLVAVPEEVERQRQAT